VDFTERIRVNGKPIPQQYVIDFVETERGFFEPLYPSFFELTTAMAFKYFAEQHVDIAVIEVGLGGRLDCTNIITPQLSVITNISFDHTAFLGNTLSAIASEKAGIIKRGVPVVIGETTPETREVFASKAAELHAPVVFAGDHDMVTPSLLSAFALKGSYQKANLNTILNAVDVLSKVTDLSVSQEVIPEALSSVVTLTGLRGRWEVIRTSPLVVCDTGHNLAAWEYLAPDIKATAQQCGGRLHIVFGMVDDKDVNGVLSLLPREADYYFTQADTHRAIPSVTLAEMAASQGLKGQAFSTVKEAYSAALASASASDFIFVGGSSYVVADFLS
jgi:dihydrofolate synthase/folylpolyglutamate synthase